MYRNSFFSGRFALVFAFVSWFLAMSFVLRLVFIFWQISDVSLRLADIARTLLTGFCFDLGTVVFLSWPAILYYSVVPSRFLGNLFDRIVGWLFSTLTVLIMVFVFFAEVTFWDEFHSRFNFIAVDYLIYTHEVVANINESYPLPILIFGVVAATFLVQYGFYKLRIFEKTFAQKASLRYRLTVLSTTVGVALLFSFFVTNDAAEWSKNRNNSEISKSGIYSFFAAMRNNRMDYAEFYTTISQDRAFSGVRKELLISQPVVRNVSRQVSVDKPLLAKPNVIFILTESLSAKFMKEFGNDENITPFLDSLAQNSLFFSNLYATGTRTVRGMEAVTLSIPPTPGQSIVKRPDNHNMRTVGSVFSEHGYSCNFFYGGDGYFDNMNSFFGGNGFDIYDRGRGSVLSDDIRTTRHNIPDAQVTFENAWGICDGDMYAKMLEVADEKYGKGKPFFNFVMTTSNHKPYSYPSGKVDLPSGKSRQGAVKYTDAAFRELFEKARKKPWFENTIFVIIADHCASSAGKDEIDVANYHIPAFIVNMPNPQKAKVDKLCSQIDIFPTLFVELGWSYRSTFFGSDVLSDTFKPRALFGTYRKLALMKGRSVMVLSDGRKQNFYDWDKNANELSPLPMDREFLTETISWYQTADYLFTHKLLK